MIPRRERIARFGEAEQGKFVAVSEVFLFVVASVLQSRKEGGCNSVALNCYP